MSGAQLGWFLAAAFLAMAALVAVHYRRRLSLEAARVVAAEQKAATAEKRLADTEQSALSAKTWLEARLADAEWRLADGERLRATLVDSLHRLPMPVWRRGPDLRVSDCNQAFALAVESAIDAAIAEGRMLGGPAVAERVTALAALARTAATPQSEALHVVVAGARRLLDVTESPLADGGTLGVAIDVTEREETQAELKRIVDGHGEVLQSLNTAIAIYGPDTRLKFFNHAFARLWRVEEEWLKTEPDHNTVMEELHTRRRLPEERNFRDFKLQRLRMFTSLLEPVEELTYIPDGTTLRTRIIPHPLGGLLFTFEDVTDNLVLESSYNTLIAVQRETLDNLHEAIAVIGSDGRLKLFNPSYARLWHLHEEMLRAEPHISEIIDQTRAFYDGAEPWEQEHDRLVARLTDRNPRRERIERADGTALDLSSVPLPDGGVLLTYIDVTDSTRVELALRERAAALETADRLKSEFISSVSYELRTPLNTIIGFAEILAHRYYGELNAKQAEYCRDIISASERLMTIINDILDLASIEAGRLTLERQPVGPRALLDGCAQIMADWARSSDLTLRVECDGDLPPIDGDERRLKQALCNLISNAIKFTPSGGMVTLAAKAAENGMAALSISDTGVGIPQEYHERIFREFERLRHREHRSQGAGLGLSLVRRIVELHGGRVELDSTPGLGTTVTCVVPLVGVSGAAIAAD
jgi:signal transduction histidine kinase